ncbi:MAG: hypothetical protein KBD53_06235 [Candidatus Omnitrophica bacterium]|nr:hypothetical protein [Candidatus Omnitrophota bacterium]
MNNICGISCNIIFESHMLQKAQEVVDYFDCNYKKIIEILNPQYGYYKKVNVSFIDKDFAAYREGSIVVNHQILYPNNWGVLVHEATHAVQNYPGEIGRLHPAWWIMEGIADYVRIKVAQDITSQYGNPTEGYTQAAHFLFWIENNVDKMAIPKLNTAFHYQCQKNKIDEIFLTTLNTTCVELLARYKYSEILGTRA